MNSNLNDKFREEMKSQIFFQNLVKDYSRKPALTTANSSVQDMLLNLIPITSKSSSKISELEEKIQKLQENLQLTIEQITQSHASREILVERIHALEKAIYLTEILTDHPSEEAVTEFSQLIQKYNQRIRSLKELGQKKHLRGEYDRFDQILLSEFSLRSDRTAI